MDIDTMDADVCDLLGEVRQRYRQRMAHISRREDSLDLAQEVALRVWANREKCLAADQETTRRWVLAIAKNTHRQRLGRHMAIKRSVLREVPRECQAGPYDRGAAVLDRMITEEDLVAVMRAVDALCATAKAAITLRYFAGLDAAAIALELGSTPNAILNRLSRALRALRTMLEDAD